MHLDVAITRMAVTNEKDEDKERTIGRKFIVTYGLYRTEGYISAPLAEQTEFTEDDLKLLWEALINMFDHDHSAARGKMTARKLIVFKHENKLGNAPTHKLFGLVKVGKKAGAEDEVIRSFEQYDVQIDPDKNCPEGVEIIEML